MHTMVRQSSRKAGQAPGTMVYTGDAQAEEVRLSLFTYGAEGTQLSEALEAEEALGLLRPERVNWLNISGLHNLDLIRTIGEYFNLHPLTLEDIVSTGQRPKVEFFDHYVFLVLRMLNLSEEGTVINEQVSLILTDNVVLSFQERQGDVFDPIRARIRGNKGRICKLGPDYLAYTLLDAVVDSYFLILEEVSERLEDLEETLIEDTTPDTLRDINAYKREMLFLRKAVWPLREVLGLLMREDSPLISAHTLTYLRDVYEHTVQVIDTVETFRDILTGMLDVYLSSVSNRMNEVMKVLTIIATIFIPLTFIAGVYGMNFAYMPELRWRWGYPAVWVLMLAVAFSLILYFRRKKWL